MHVLIIARQRHITQNTVSLHFTHRNTISIIQVYLSDKTLTTIWSKKNLGVDVQQ